MNELNQIIEAVEACGDSAILATVVDVVGSAYRRPGARMLILPGGDHIGTISGGCLERDLCREAQSLVSDGPKLISFDTRSDSTNFNPRYNLGCSGIIYVLLERVTNASDCPMEIVRRVFKHEHSEIVATVYQSEIDKFKIGSRLTADELLAINSDFAPLVKRVESDGQRICVQLSETDNSARVLIERIDPPRPMAIFGAGEDAIPLSSIATQMGWNVTIVDDRPEHLTRSRFPDARRLVCSPAAEARDKIKMTRQSVAILMTHSFSKDVALLPWLLNSDAFYVGLLGPKSRTGKIIQHLHADQNMPASDGIDKLHTPVGLDIGAVNPSEIAVAIIAEVIAETHSRSGGKLGQRNDPIHQPVIHELIDLGAHQTANVKS